MMQHLSVLSHTHILRNGLLFSGQQWLLQLWLIAHEHLLAF